MSVSHMSTTVGLSSSSASAAYATPAADNQPRPIHLSTERFVLRSLRADDASQDYMNWLADPEIMKPYNGPLVRVSREQLAGYIESHNNVWNFLIGIFERQSGRHIGNYVAIVDRKNRRVETHVYIGDKAFWGSKVVLETRAALLDHFFFERGIEKATGGPAARNFPAIFNYKAQGWRLEGILKGHLKSQFDEGRLDIYQFALLRDEWLAIRAGKCT